MDGSIGAHSVCYKQLILDEILQEQNLFLSSRLSSMGKRRPQISRARRLSFAVSVSSTAFTQGFPSPGHSAGAVAWQKNLPATQARCLRV